MEEDNFQDIMRKLVDEPEREESLEKTRREEEESAGEYYPIREGREEREWAETRTPGPQKVDARYVLITTPDYGNIMLSHKLNMWAVPDSHVRMLNDWFHTSKSMYLIYSVKGTFHVQGFARMENPITYNSPSKAINFQLESSERVGYMDVKWSYQANISFEELAHIYVPQGEERVPVELERGRGVEICRQISMKALSKMRMAGMSPVPRYSPMMSLPPYYMNQYPRMGYMPPELMQPSHHDMGIRGMQLSGYRGRPRMPRQYRGGGPPVPPHYRLPRQRLRDRERDRITRGGEHSPSSSPTKSPTPHHDRVRPNRISDRGVSDRERDHRRLASTSPRHPRKYLYTIYIYIQVSKFDLYKYI